MEGKVIDNAYVTWRRPEHVFHKFNSFGISLRILAELRKEGIELIRIEYLSNGRMRHYTSSVSQFLGSDLEYNWNGDVQKHVKLSSLKLDL